MLAAPMPTPNDGQTPPVPMVNPTQTLAWRKLRAHRERLDHFDLRRAFADDAQRFARDARSFDDAGVALHVDLSRHRIDAAVWSDLFALARECGLTQRMAAQFAGERVNTTEHRAALHMALRAQAGDDYRVDGKSVVAEVLAVRDRFLSFAESVRAGNWRGFRGDRITDIVHLGIGGSDAGPRMMVEALAPFHDGPRVHFVSNADGWHLALTLRELDPKRTLFVVASKTFTTAETMANAHSARRWTVEAFGDATAVAHHFVAVSTNLDAVGAFGIAPERMFPFWDWVGGRYSLWSSVGLPIALAVGAERFEQMLRGARAMDLHFVRAPLESNLPVALALLGIWYLNFWDVQTHSVAPYHQPLHLLSLHLQQLEMESNGKRVTLDGETVDWHTAPVVWGEAGTNGQHAYFQALHQGTAWMPVDFIVAAHGDHGLAGHHEMLVANCFAQAQALMRGKTRDEAYAELRARGMSDDEAQSLAPHREFPGNRPSTTILAKRFDPATLGALIAMYEHKVFVQGAIWNVNPFDQWGVELGKQLAHGVNAALASDGQPVQDPATAGLIAQWHALRRE